jgi:hypothetical protein
MPARATRAKRAAGKLRMKLSDGIPTSYLFFNVPSDRASEPYPSEPLKPGKEYCRLRLVEVQWTGQAPPKQAKVIFANTHFTYGGAQVSTPSLIGSERLRSPTSSVSGAANRLVLNRSLTPLFPYRGGPIDFQCGLYSIDSGEVITGWIETLEQLSDLMQSPELSMRLPVVEPLLSGFGSLSVDRNARAEVA